MSIILFDYDYLLSKNINLLKNLNEKIFQDDNNKRGLIIILPKDIVNKMKYLIQENREDFINNEMKNNIQEIIPFTYSPNKKEISIPLKNSKLFYNNVNDILKSIYENFPHNYKIKLESTLNNPRNLELCKNFSYPILSGLNDNIYFFVKNDMNKPFNYETNKYLFNKVKLDYNILKQTGLSSIPCHLYLNFDEKTINNLKLNANKIFEKEKKFDGLEISDKFKIKNISNNNDGKLITLEMHSLNPNIGNGDSVDVVFSKYTYHTHPKKTYEKFKVKLAWPSWQDFESFFILFKNGVTIFHLISTLEGAYILTINPKIIDYISNLSDSKVKRIVKKYYDINYPSYDKKYLKQNKSTPKTPEEFIDLVNNLKIKLKDVTLPPLFNVNFYPWNKFTEDVMIPINYLSGANQTCSYSDLQNF